MSTGRPEQLHRAAFAVLDAATDELAQTVPDAQAVTDAALEEFSTLGAADRARVAARLALSAAQLHRCLLQFLPARDVDDLLGRELHTSGQTLTAPRKDAQA